MLTIWPITGWFIISLFYLQFLPVNLIFNFDDLIFRQQSKALLRLQKDCSKPSEPVQLLKFLKLDLILDAFAFHGLVSLYFKASLVVVTATVRSAFFDLSSINIILLDSALHDSCSFLPVWQWLLLAFYGYPLTLSSFVHFFPKLPAFSAFASWNHVFSLNFLIVMDSFFSDASLNVNFSSSKHLLTLAY